MLLALTSLLLLAEPAAQARPKLVVLQFTVAGGAAPEVAQALSQAVTAEVAHRGFFQVIAASEVATLLGVERQKELLGCSEGAQSCLAELTGALGARFVLSGTLAKLGDTWQLTMQTLDSATAQPVGRSTRLGKDLDSLRETLPFAVSEATGTPPPPQPSRLPGYALVTAGALGVVLGGLVGQDALSQERAVNEELARGPATDSLDTYAHYRQRAVQIGQRKTISLGLLLAGAGLVGLGLWRLPSATVGTSTQVALVPSLGGVALAGVLR